MTGQEKRDILFTCLFGHTAIIRSGLLVHQTPMPTSGFANLQVSNVQSYREVLENLIEIGEVKSWLRESAWWTIGLAIDTVQAASPSVLWKAEALNTTVNHLFSKEPGLWTSEKIAVLFKLQPLVPNYDWDSTLTPTFKGRNLFSSVNLVPLAQVLKVILDIISLHQ